MQTILASLVVFAVFAGRVAPSQFSDATSGSSVSAATHHDQRLRFNQSSLSWSAPAPTFVLFPPIADRAHLASALQTVSALQTKGFHFTRPPPVS
jgi:hypothetical protein